MYRCIKHSFFGISELIDIVGIIDIINSNLGVLLSI